MKKEQKINWDKNISELLKKHNVKPTSIGEITNILESKKVLSYSIKATYQKTKYVIHKIKNFMKFFNFKDKKI